MDSANDLREKACALRRLLELYAPSEADIRVAYEWIRPLLDEIDAGTVTAPHEFPYGWIFFRGENNLPAYPDVCNAAAELANALEAE